MLATDFTDLPAGRQVYTDYFINKKRMKLLILF